MELNQKRIGLFGGTFNPIHMGHINSMLTITQKMGLDKVYAIPTSKNPLKIVAAKDEDSKGNKIVAGQPTADERLKMVEMGLESYEDTIVVDGREIERGGVSYTIDTIEEYCNESSAEVYLIIGMDSFSTFDQWKDYEKILEKVNLVVTSRPGFKLPRKEEVLPEGLKSLVAIFDPHYIELTSGKNIQFVALKDLEVSSSEVRKRIRIGKGVEQYLPLKVEEFVKQAGFYCPEGLKVSSYEELTKFCANILFENKGGMVKAFDLRGTDAPCEFTVIVSGTSTRHSQALAEHVVKEVKNEYGLSTYGLEGVREGQWVLIDYGTLIIHVFYDYVRSEYALEELWREGKDMELQDPALQ